MKWSKPATGAVSILRDLISLQANATQADDLELAERIEKEINERELDAARTIRQSRNGLSTIFPCTLESRLACCVGISTVRRAFER